jgi:hypothetical protein
MAKSIGPSIAALVGSGAPSAPCAHFQLGRLLATPGALDLLDRTATDGLVLVQRHQSADWGDLSPDDVAANDFAVRNGLRILSSYRLPPTERIWIITEADRSATTLLLPEEY